MNAEKFDHKTPVSADALARLSELAQEFDEAKARLDELKAKVSEQESVCRRLEFGDIPKQMRLCRQKKLTTDNGREISVDPVYKCKIREGRLEDALLWLARHGEAGSIKYRVGRRFSMREQRKAQAMASRIRGQGVEPDVEKKVEPSTLRRIFREISEDGRSMPPEFFETEILERATIKNEGGPRAQGPSTRSTSAQG